MPVDELIHECSLRNSKSILFSASINSGSCHLQEVASTWILLELPSNHSDKSEDLRNISKPASNLRLGVRTPPTNLSGGLPLIDCQLSHTPYIHSQQLSSSVHPCSSVRNLRNRHSVVTNVPLDWLDTPVVTYRHTCVCVLCLGESSFR